MRTKSAQAAAVIANPSHSARALVTIYSSAGVAGPTWGTGSADGQMDPVLDVEVDQSIDSFRTATVKLQRQQGLYSLAPLVQTGNPLFGAEPPVFINRRVVIEAELQLTDITGTPAGLRETIFDGYIDEVSWPDDAMELVCTDKSAKLRDTWIESERVYSLAQGANAVKGCLVWRSTLPALAVNDLVIPSDKLANGHFYKVTTATSAQGTTEPTWPTGGGATVVSGGVTFTEAGATAITGTAIETIIQQVLNDNGLGSLVTLQTPSSPGWLVKPYIQQRESVMSAIQAMVDQLGWWARFEWNSGLAKYELTLAQPDRTSVTVQKVLDVAEEVECTDLKVNTWSIRNVVRVIYSDSANRSPTGVPIRTVREVSDSASIAKYGRRFMEIAEDDASMIDTSTEADRLANAVLADLKEPTLGTSLGFPIDFYLELGDRITIPADGLRFTADQTLATESLKHSFTANSASTSVTLQGAPAALRSGWLDKDGRLNASDVHQISLNNSSGTTLNHSPAVGGQRFTTVETRAKDALNQGNELHISTISGFTPNAATLAASGETDSFEVLHLVPGKTHYAKLVPISKNASRLVRGEPSAEVAFVAGRAQAGHYESTSTQSHLPLNGNFEHQTDSGGPFDHWSVVTRPSETTETWGGSVDALTDPDKGKCVFLKASGTQRGNFVSSPFEVRRGIRNLNIYLSIKRSGSSAVSGKDLIVDVFGFSDAALTTQIINYSVTLSGDSAGPYPALNTWYPVVIDFGTGYGPIPQNVNFLQIGLRRGTTGDATFSWVVGDVYEQEADFYRAQIDKLTAASVVLPAQGGSGTVVSDTLSAYEEGTWVPTCPSGFNATPTVTVTHAKYTKIGRLVHFNLWISITGTANGNEFRIGNLPFAAVKPGSCIVTYFTKAAWTSPLVGQVLDGGSYIYFNKWTNGSQPFIGTDFASGTAILAHGFYETT